jgi:hypothetical protein
MVEPQNTTSAAQDALQLVKLAEEALRAQSFEEFTAGELTWSDQAVSLEEHLALFEEMVLGHVDRFLEINETDT